MPLHLITDFVVVVSLQIWNVRRWQRYHTHFKFNRTLVEPVIFTSWIEFEFLLFSVISSHYKDVHPYQCYFRRNVDASLIHMVLGSGLHLCFSSAQWASTSATKCHLAWPQRKRSCHSKCTLRLDCWSICRCTCYTTTPPPSASDIDAKTIRAILCGESQVIVKTQRIACL